MADKEEIRGKRLESLSRRDFSSLTPEVVDELRSIPWAEAAGKLTGVYPPGHLDELRSEWGDASDTA